MAGTIVAGLASGFDWQSMVSQLSDVERAPERKLQSEQSVLQRRNTAYGNIATELAALKTDVDALKDPQLFNSRLSQVGDSAVASASADASAALGLYTFNFTQLATASLQRGASDAGARLAAADDVSALVVSNAAFATGITAGTFTVNGKQVTLATSDTLQQVFDKISTATSGSVTAAYDHVTD